MADETDSGPAEPAVCGAEQACPTGIFEYTEFCKHHLINTLSDQVAFSTTEGHQSFIDQLSPPLSPASTSREERFPPYYDDYPQPLCIAEGGPSPMFLNATAAPATTPPAPATTTAAAAFHPLAATEVAFIFPAVW